MGGDPDNRFVTLHEAIGELRPRIVGMDARNLKAFIQTAVMTGMIPYAKDGIDVWWSERALADLDRPAPGRGVSEIDALLEGRQLPLKRLVLFMSQHLIVQPPAFVADREAVIDPPTVARGRKPKYDWTAARMDMVHDLVLNDVGEPFRWSDYEKKMLAWFGLHNKGDEPVESEIRKHVRLAFDEFKAQQARLAKAVK